MNNKQTDLANLMLALIISMSILFYWQYFIENPRKENEAMLQRMNAQNQQIVKPKEVVEAPKPREELIKESPRVRIKSDLLQGSISLKGLRFDDLLLVQYHETLNPYSDKVVLLSPAKSAESYYAELGWLSSNPNLKLPNQDSVWSSDGSELTPDHPITLSWNNGVGVIFTVKMSMDDKYMFTVHASAQDQAGKSIDAVSYASLNRTYDVKTHPALGILHEGPLGVFDGILHETSYKKLTEQQAQGYESQSGWLGITDKYWLTAIIPGQKQAFSSKFTYYSSNGRDHFQASYQAQKSNVDLHLFFGAKVMSMLEGYESQYNIPLFDHAVDLGWFDFLTKPILKILTYFYQLVGNFGIAILVLTVIVKLFMYPLASKSFRSMNQMKKLQPKMTDIRERFKDDKLKMNQEMMELYKREKVNPASGCLPMFIQIPVFFSLYKVLYVTLEMRHAPFYGWIHDLSAPDPTNIFTLFGLIPWHTPAFLHLGIWPMLMCATMVIQQHQSPPPPDPAQAKMMKLLPFFFLFLFSSFASGLVIYWTWSNVLTILQQWYIKHKHSD